MRVEIHVSAHLSEQKMYSFDDERRLLLAITEQLKTPLLQIARAAELGKNESSSEYIDSIESIAESTLRLLDNYLLTIKLNTEPKTLFEPVSLSAVLFGTANRLQKLASLYDCRIELDVRGRFEPVLANRSALEAALTSLATVFIESQNNHKDYKKSAVTLAVHRSRWGLVAGAYADTDGLNADMLRRARQLYGQARQPLTPFAQSGSAGVFVADSLLSSMATRLRIAHHHKTRGLAATFTPSQQLRFV